MSGKEPAPEPSPASPCPSPCPRGSSGRLVQAGPSQAKAFAKIHRQVFPDAWDEAAFATLLAQPGVRALAVADTVEPGTLYGFILGRAVADEGEVVVLAVLPGYRRRGIGRGLTAGLMACLEAQGVTRLFLEVAESNIPALALYRSLGFSVLGRRRGYYVRRGGAAEDAIVMAASCAVPCSGWRA